MGEILLGGFLTLLGSWTAIWFQLQNSRKLKMEEVIAEKKVEANAQAYSRIKEVEARFQQCSLEDTLKYVLGQEDWFFDNRLFLPGNFAALWMKVRLDLTRLGRKQQSPTATSSKELEEIDDGIVQAINGAIREIYEDMGVGSKTVGGNRIA